MKKIFSLFAALLFVGSMWAVDYALAYTLTPEASSASGSSAYATAIDITIDGIKWNVMGNTSLVPWRIGGKNLTKEDRSLYSKTAIEGDVAKIEITHAGASSVTVHSMTVVVATNSNFAEASIVSTLTPTFNASGTVTVTRPDGKDWSNCYYKITYNVTIGGSNKFIAFSEAKFYTAAVKSAVTIGSHVGGSLEVTGADDLSEVTSGTELTVSATPDAENHYIGGVVKVTKTSDASDVTTDVLSGSTLTMPAYAITVSATFTPTYKINLVAEGGSIALDYTAGGAAEGYAIAGTVIEAEATADGTHTFKSLEVSDNAIDVTVVDNLAEFTMPAAAVTVTATFDEVKDPAISVDETVLAFGSVDPNSTPVPQTFHVSGVNLSEGTLTIASNNEAFTVSPTSINVNGTLAETEVTVTPVTTTAGTFNGKITISGVNDLSKEVALSLTVKETYTITWHVCGKVDEITYVIEGNKIAPIANPVLSPDYEEKEFQGWLTTELATTNVKPTFVNFDELAAPEADAEYYAVFAKVEEGEKQEETVFEQTGTAAPANYTVTVNAENKTDYYQDGSDTSYPGTRYVQVKVTNSDTQIIPIAPTTITVTAILGGGSEKELTNSVYAVLVDKDGNAVGDPVVISTEITSKSGSEFVANMPVANYASVRGVKLTHVKDASYNVRYYGITLEYEGTPISITGYTTSVAQKHAVTFSAPANGTLVVKNAGVAINSGDKFAAGTTLTVEAEPTSEIYELATLTANGADIKNDKEFTVADANVEVVATFALKPFASLEALADAGLADGTDVVVSFSNVEITQLDGILGAVYTTVKDNEDRTVGIVASEYLDPSWIVGGFVSGTAIEGTWKVGATKSTLNTKNGWTGIEYTKPEAPISWSATEATAYTIGKAYELPTLNNEKGLTVAYSSTNTASATINADGVVTLVAAGTTTIKATYTEDVYQGKVVEYTLNVYVPDYITIGGELTNDEYDNGDVFDFTGLTATLTYTDGETLDVTAVATWNINETANKVVYPRNTPTVMASYAGKTGIEYNVPITFKKYAVTFNTPEHGTLTVSNGVNVLKSGDAVVKGTGLVVYATPASSDYVLSSLTANGADIEQGGDAYTVGTEAVNIVATFTEKPDAPIAWMHADTVAKNLTIYLDKEYTLPTLSNEQSLVVELTSSNESVAVFDGTELKVAGVGESTISAEFFGNGDYKAKKVSYDLKVVEKTPTAINNIDSNEAVVKTMENGVLIIRRGNKTFNAQGQLLK